RSGREGGGRLARRLGVGAGMPVPIFWPPESLFLGIAPGGPAVLEETRWHDLLVDGKPSSTWNDFLAVYEAASAAAAKQRWLFDWKKAAPERTLNLEAVGRQGFTETQTDFFVLPPWRAAGFSGTPQFEILLREKGDWIGTVW